MGGGWDFATNKQFTGEREKPVRATFRREIEQCDAPVVLTLFLCGMNRLVPVATIKIKRLIMMPPNTNSLERELLAIRCQLGELAAFDELVDRWHAPLWRYIRRMADRDELAEEILQETWLRVLRGIVKLREPASLVPWLFGIARRVLMDHLRQKYKQPASNEGLDDQVVQTAEIDSRADIEHLLYEVDRLPLPQRELLTLYYLEELTVDEVAGVLGIPAGTVKSRLHHVRNLLKRNLLNEES